MAYPGWPIVTAALRGGVKVVDFLLAHGADIDTEDSHGKTVLMYAVQYGQEDAVKLLIARGANVFAQADYDYNNTALKLAENTGRTEIAGLLQIVEFLSRAPDDPRHWGEHRSALVESARAQVDDRPGGQRRLDRVDEANCRVSRYSPSDEGRCEMRRDDVAARSAEVA